LAPEYALLGQLTKKADVYSFGILVLEVISGNSSTRAAFGDEYMVLVEWVKLKASYLNKNIYSSMFVLMFLTSEKIIHFQNVKCENKQYSML